MDSSSPSSFVIPGLPPNAPTAYNQLYFNLTGLSPGPHQLVVTYHGSSNKAPLAVDYFYIANASSDTTSSSASPASTSSPITSSSSSSTSTSTSHSSIHSASVRLGPIVGGVVGGVFAVAIICLLIFFILRRRRQTPLQHRPGPLDLTSERPDPSFIAGPYTGHSAPSEGASSHVLPNGSLLSSNDPSHGWSSSSRGVPVGLPSGKPPQRQVMIHQDSGVRLAPNREEDSVEDSEMIEMPPQYTRV